ncbi:hypothetical protein SSAG_02414 [Streptomyces sp. Mg1]|nr:hypothetical protein SSAG_02414 [Streptomyces sp. Mg1]
MADPPPKRPRFPVHPAVVIREGLNSVHGGHQARDRAEIRVLREGVESRPAGAAGPDRHGRRRGRP